MKTLEEHLVEKIHGEVSLLWAVADSDGLYRSDVVNRLLADKGMEIVIFDDPVAFRFFYETTMRAKVEERAGGFVILFDPLTTGFTRLPADIYLQSRRLEYSLGDLFPRLSRKVLKELDPIVLSRLWQKSDSLPSHALSDKETCDISLRLGYKIEPSLIETFNDVTRLLLELHISKQTLPNVLIQRLAEITHKAFLNIDLLLRKPAEFQGFLQKQWADYVIPENRVRYSSQEAIDFGDPSLRSYLDDLFQEGFLQPIDTRSGNLPEWVQQLGVRKKGSALIDHDDHRRNLLNALPDETSSYLDWLSFGQRYSHYTASCFSEEEADCQKTFWSKVWEPINASFTQWAAMTLDSLNNLPPNRPAVIHHIPRFLSRRVTAGRKVALLVLDGLSLSQWNIIKGEVRQKVHGIQFEESACFTLVPSITNVCRQALYSGELPIYFSNSIDRTSDDEVRWRSFWASSTAKGASCKLINLLGQENDLVDLREAFRDSPTALGVTIRMPDEIMHGSRLGWNGMSQQLRLWARKEFLAQTISELLDASYEVFLTADHGNLESVGEGAFSEGAMVDRAGERVRIYSDKTLQENAVTILKERATAPNVKSLPKNYLPVVHTGQGAFFTKGDTGVCHGGMSIDEMLVPFIEISRGSET